MQSYDKQEYVYSCYVHLYNISRKYFQSTFFEIKLQYRRRNHMLGLQNVHDKRLLDKTRESVTRYVM